jgi:hypothetical protein
MLAIPSWMKFWGLTLVLILFFSLGPNTCDSGLNIEKIPCPLDLGNNYGNNYSATANIINKI